MVENSFYNIINVLFCASFWHTISDKSFFDDFEKSVNFSCVEFLVISRIIDFVQGEFHRIGSLLLGSFWSEMFFARSVET
jgi:hypothetical protein